MIHNRPRGRILVRLSHDAPGKTQIGRMLTHHIASVLCKIPGTRRIRIRKHAHTLSNFRYEKRKNLV